MTRTTLLKYAILTLTLTRTVLFTLSTEIKLLHSQRWILGQMLKRISGQMLGWILGQMSGWILGQVLGWILGRI